jgi:hypothetical protein
MREDLVEPGWLPEALKRKVDMNGFPTIVPDFIS